MHTYIELFSKSPHPQWVYDRDTLAFLAVNEATSQCYGYSHEEFLAMTIQDIYRPEDVDELMEMSSNGLSSLNATKIWQHRKKDGTLFFAEVSVYGCEFVGQPAIAGIVYDVSVRMRVLHDLQRSEELLSQIFQSVPLALGISTLNEGHILKVNRHFLELTGFNENEVIGHTVTPLGIWEPASQRDKLLNRLEEKGSIRNAEATWKTKSGQVLDVLIYMDPIEIWGEACIFVIALDITERKQVEKDRLEAEHLRLEVYKEREVLELKEHFISTMSHQFRTPLSVILAAKGTLETYYDRLSEDRRKLHFQNIEDQVYYATNLLDEVLTLSKARAGKTKFVPLRLNLIPFCEKLLEQIRMTETEAHHYIFTHDDEALEIDGDKTLLQHILINLLSNAIKYSPENGEIRLDLKRENGDVVFRVSDQGIGIPLEDQKHLFEPFFRASNVKKFKGTGLGLAIVKESAETHKGSISWESQIGKGTTFLVRLPISAAT